MTELPGQPNLSQLMEAVVEAAGEQIRVAIPGILASVSSDLSTATVQPAISRSGSGSDPSIPDVRLLWPKFANGRITWPVESGDACLIVFADRSLEEWQAADGERRVAAVDPRTHDLTDAVAIPLGPAEAASGRAGDISIQLTGGPGDIETAEVRVQSDRKIALGSTGKSGSYTTHAGTPTPWTDETCELVALLLDVLGAITSKSPIIDLSTTPGAILPTVYDTLIEARSKLEAIKGSL